MEFCPYSGEARPSSDQSFILSKGSFILSLGYVVKTSLMMIVIPSGLKCWNDLSSPVRCLSVTYSLTLRANAAYWSQKTNLT